MITKAQIDARDAYIDNLEDFIHSGIHLTESDILEFIKDRQTIENADREAAEMQSIDEQKLALWEEVTSGIRNAYKIARADGRFAYMQDFERLIKRIEAISASPKDDMSEIKAVWDKAVERCTKGGLR